MSLRFSHKAPVERAIDLSDEQVFDVVYKSYYHPLRYFAAKYVDADDAEDIVENLFLKFWNKKQGFPDKQVMQAYLYQSVRNACLDYIKVSRNAERRHQVVSDTSPLINDDHLNQMIKAEVLAEIYRAVNNLPSQCARVITKSYLEGKSNAEIAEEMGLSEQTVKNYKGRGIDILKDKLSGPAFTLLLLLLPWR